MRSALSQRTLRAGIVVAVLGSLTLVPAVETVAASTPSSASTAVSQKASPDADETAGAAQYKKKTQKKKPRPVRVVKEYTEFDGKYMVHTQVLSNGKVIKWRTKAHIIDNPTPTPAPKPVPNPAPEDQ